MKCLIFVCLFVCLTSCHAGALRCHPGVADKSCTESKSENLDTREPSEATEAQCLAGSEWQSNCHYCRCSEGGVAECLKQSICDTQIFEEPVVCKPNTTFQRDCNTCVCLENGLGLCSLELCRRSTYKGSLELLDEEESDKEPTTKSASSNNLTPFETRVEQNFLDQIVLKRSVLCKPHEEFMKECNPCKCSDDGLSFTCTHNECLDDKETNTETEGKDTNKEVEVFMQSEGVDHIERHSVCHARSTFYVSCNTCQCNEHGTDYTCTNKVCPLPADVELFHELKTIKSSKYNTTKVCDANRMFVMDCNTCWCNEDGTSYFCTRKVCVPVLPDDQQEFGGIPAKDLRVILKECHPNEVFELDCNICHCNADGKSYACTRKACEEDDKKKLTSRKVRALTSETNKACQPGQEFRMDCNKCLCDDLGEDFSCTRIDCNAPTGVRTKRDTSEKVAMKCVPGHIFDRNCNVCRCTKDGQFATCTIKRCSKPDVSDDLPGSDLGFRCNAGEQFQRDCNDCTCSADGRSVFCTLRLCDVDIASDI